MKICTLILLTMLMVACTAKPPAADQPTVETPTASAKVAKVVFVGKQDACDCTKKRITDSWAALDGALSKRLDIAVERLQIDSDEAAVAPLLEIRAVMVIPGAYFLDADGGIIDLLQGEISADQVTRLL